MVKTVTGTQSKPTQNYMDALALYGNSRYQFVNCSGNPGSLTFKKGVKFMIDNRDNETHQIKIGTKSYTLGAYSYAIVSVAKAASFNITCDGGGAAHANIEN